MARLKPLVRPLGLLIVLAALAYLARALHDHWAELGAWRPGAAGLGGGAALALAYGASLFLLAESWHRIVGLFGAEPRRRSWASYTMTQIARYLPGNIAHVLGRAVWLRGGPLDSAALTRASLLELVLVPCGALLALLLLSPVLPLTIIAAALKVPAPLLAAGLVLGGIVAALAARLLIARSGAPMRALLPSLGLSTLFMLMLGASFAGVAQLVSDVPVVLAMAVGLAGWIVGYATPGAPGGLGPREALIVFLLAGQATPSEALLIAMLFRLVTTLGELACFGAGALHHHGATVRRAARHPA